MIILFYQISKLSKVFFVGKQYGDKCTVFTKGSDVPFTWIFAGNITKKGLQFWEQVLSSARRVSSS